LFPQIDYIFSINRGKQFFVAIAQLVHLFIDAIHQNACKFGEFQNLRPIYQYSPRVDRNVSGHDFQYDAISRFADKLRSIGV